jgi:hypothetical protein
MPIEHANTLVNKANALMNLPDHPEATHNPRNLSAAVQLLTAAEGLYRSHGVLDRAEIAARCRAELERDLGGAGVGVTDAIPAAAAAAADGVGGQ